MVHNRRANPLDGFLEANMIICDQKLPPRLSCGPEYEASTHNVIHLVQKAGGQVQHTLHSAACQVTLPLALEDSRNSPPEGGGGRTCCITSTIWCS